MTHYDNLGLAVTASDDEITDAYRALVKVVHPDMGGDAVMFGILTESFDVLSDAAQRAAYDRQLMEAIEPVEPVEPVEQPAATATRAESMSLFDRVALDSYNRGSAGTAGELVTTAMTAYFVVRFVLGPMVLIGGIMMFVPFLPVRMLGGIIVLLGLASPCFVAHGARTTRKKARRRMKP